VFCDLNFTIVYIHILCRGGGRGTFKLLCYVMIFNCVKMSPKNQEETCFRIPFKNNNGLRTDGETK